MDKQLILKTLEKVKTSSPQRKFQQSIEMIVNLRDVNIKRNDEQVDIFVDLPRNRGRKVKICGMVDKQLLKGAKDNFDLVIEKEEFEAWSKKPKEFKKVAGKYDYFVAQATIMPLVARNFGRVLGKKGKVPNPKAGCVVPPNADLSQTKNKLTNLVRLKAKTEPSIKCSVGHEKMEADDIAENIMHAYNKIKTTLPREENQIKEVLLKVTMGPAVRVEK